MTFFKSPSIPLYKRGRSVLPHSRQLKPQSPLPVAGEGLPLPRSFPPGVCRQAGRRESEQTSGFSPTHPLTGSPAHLLIRGGRESYHIQFEMTSFKSPSIPLYKRGRSVPPFGKGGLGGISHIFCSGALRSEKNHLKL